MIRAGKLRHTLTFKVKKETKDDYGSTIESFKDSFTAKAEVLDSRASSGIISDGQDLQKTTSFRLRYNRRIEETLFIEYKGDHYEIDSVENISGLNRELIIDAIKYV
jgi:SPP1 family predicted phage head-tail adaptor